MGRLEGRIALVTGGAGILGRAMCERLAAEGAKVAIADLNEDMGKAVDASIGETAFFVPLDVTSETSWSTAIKTVVAKWGGLDILVNNAGFLKPATIEECTLADWRKTLQVNGDGAFLGCKFAVAAMKSRHKNASSGVIISMSSNMGLRGRAQHPAYTASKAAIRLLTQSVAKHCGEQGYNIRTVAVLPGAIDSDMLWLNIPPGMSKDDYAEIVRARHPIGRIGTPKDIADAIVFLASDEASFINGTDFYVDGGATI